MTRCRFAGITMSTIDAQPIAAVATAESLGYTVSLTDGWPGPTNAAFAPAANCLCRSRCNARASSVGGRQARQLLGWRRGAIDPSALPYRRSLRARAVATPVRAERQGADQRGDK